MTVAFIGIDLASMRVPASRRDARRSACAEAAGSAGEIAGRTGFSGALHDRHRSLHRRLLLAKGVRTLGHAALVIAPQYVKPFVKHRQNDRNDAEAICTALMHATMKFVPPKSELKQDIQALHRARRRLVNHRTALVSQMRGLLLDRGVPIALSIGRARQAIPVIIADTSNVSTAMAREIIAELFDFMGQLDERISAFDRRIDAVFKSNADRGRLARICGVGPKTATAVVVAVGDGKEFKSGRHMAAPREMRASGTTMGLVPRQRSSGDKRVLMGISKRGDKHLRCLLVHGARSVVRVSQRKTDPFSQWVNALRERRGLNRAIDPVATENARIIWAMLNRNEEFHAHA